MEKESEQEKRSRTGGDQGEAYEPYRPEEPADKTTRREEQEEIREASRHATRETTSDEELGGEEPISREQAEKEMHDAARRAQEEGKISS